MDRKHKWSFGVFVAIRSRGWSTRPNNFLLVRHNYGEKKWSLPGGGLNQGEEADVGVIREAKEETGLDIGICHPHIGIFPLKKSLGMVILFEGHIIGGNGGQFHPVNQEEISDCRFFTFQEIAAMHARKEIYPAQFELMELARLVNRKCWPVYDWSAKTKS